MSSTFFWQLKVLSSLNWSLPALVVKQKPPGMKCQLDITWWQEHTLHTLWDFILPSVPTCKAQLALISMKIHSYWENRTLSSGRGKRRKVSHFKANLFCTGSIFPSVINRQAVQDKRHVPWHQEKRYCHFMLLRRNPKFDFGGQS